LCNRIQMGRALLTPGCTHEVQFAEPFDVPCKAFFTPVAAPIVVKELELRPDGMTLLSSFAREEDLAARQVLVFWLACGLKGLENTPLWRVHLCSAATHFDKGLYKPALLDCAVSFEAFLEDFLRRHLTRRYGEEISDYVLERGWRVEDRCGELLSLAVGHRLPERRDLWEAWKLGVQEPRNRLAHGKRCLVGQEEAERAYQAVYQAIAWMQSLAPSDGEDSLV